MIRNLLGRVAPGAVVMCGVTMAALAVTPSLAQVAAGRSGSSAIIELAAPRVTDYWVSINRQTGGLLVFDGYVPDQTTLDRLASDTNGDVSFLKLGSGAPDTYSSGVEFGLKLLQHLSEGRVAINGQALTISGVALDQANADAIATLLTNDLPQGLTLARSEVTLTEAAASSVVTDADEPSPAANGNQLVAAQQDGSATAEPDAAASEAPPSGVGEGASATLASAPVGEGAQIERCQARLAELSAHNAILFQSGNAVIAESANAELDLFAQALALCPDTRIAVEGHTDSDGDDQLNLALSVARAEAVVGALVKRGVAASRLYAIGYGESQPVADNATPDGKRQNRRIVVSVHEGALGDR